MQLDRRRALDALWRYIGHESSRDLRDIDDEHVEALSALFLRQSYEQKVQIYLGYQIAMEMADSLQVWEFGSLVHGRILGDDWFRDFRRWLILQGRTVFDTAVRNPDDLAGFQWTEEPGSIEVLVDYMGALEEFEDRFDLVNIVPQAGAGWRWFDSSYEKIKNKYPRLWLRAGHLFSWDQVVEPMDPMASKQGADQCIAPGLGVVRIGDRVKHKRLGEAVVVAILIAEGATVELEFAFGREVFDISSDMFDVV